MNSEEITETIETAAEPTEPDLAAPPDAVAGSGRPRRRWIALGVVVILALTAGGWFGWRYLEGPRITARGQQISHPERLLRQAESALMATAHKVGAATDGSTRCYYAVYSGKRLAGTLASDITETLYCGPVLFVDGSPTKSWVTFGLIVGRGTVQLQSMSINRDASPPSNVRLLRPDGRTAPRGAGKLSSPVPPQAKADTLTLLSETSPEPPMLKPHATMIMDGTGDLVISETGVMKRYGFGDTARTAPPGQELVVFQFSYLPGAADPLVTPSSYFVQVDGGAKRKIDLGPSAPSDLSFGVVAVPTTARLVTLIVDSLGLEQSVSLLDGKPASGNLALASRDSGALTQSAFVQVDVPVTWDNGHQAVFHTTSNGEQLYYFYTSDDSAFYPSRPTDAFLHIGLTFTDSTDPKHGTYQFEPSALHLTSKDGTSYPVFNVDTTGNDYINNVFVVPASFSGGTLTISGTAFVSDGESYTVDSPVTIPIQMPN